MDKENDYRHGRHVASAVQVHLVFVTQYRRGVFNHEMLTRCEEIMRKVCEDFEAELKEFNGERDHVHPLINYPPKVAVSKLVNSLKAVSARRIRQEFTGRITRAIMHGHLWSPSYLSASCGGAPLAIVRQYIEQQKRPLQSARQSSLEMHSSPA
ncbi:IS200/IS605 family transposase [Streptomyces sp. NBC_01750]|uniref:IS200/IS605 family transposase n=1 Tax=Streptomyces sp. NBC_01750 TaxID=2975928 RepID=UPI002DDBEB0F|nr:IS200/IS605 family transposase [Streptomyces sp. NBC_01750]WSD30800.1 IS200/IS605 family transposase [Streptomyces sp. NBC_01750]